MTFHNLSFCESAAIRANSSQNIRTVRGCVWLNELVSGVVTDTTEIAVRERYSIRSVNMTVSVAFLAPSLVKAVVQGTLLRGVGYARLCDLPAEWPRQYRVLGLEHKPSSASGKRKFGP